MSETAAAKNLASYPIETAFAIDPARESRSGSPRDHQRETVIPSDGPSKGGHKAVIVVLHGVSWEELAAADVPALQALLRRATVGVMNSRPLATPNDLAPYVSIGAGRLATAGFERADMWSGRSVVRRARYMQRLREANDRAETQAEPGLLATLLRAEGLRTGILSPGIEISWPPSTPIALDGKGGLDYWGPGAQVEGRFQLPAKAPPADFLLIDLSGMQAIACIQGPAPTSPDSRSVRSLSSYRQLFERIGRSMNGARDLLIIISPTCPLYSPAKLILPYSEYARRAPSDGFYALYRPGKLMSYSPIAIIGPGFKPGLLTSASTRQPGIVANVDVAPTILQYFGIYSPLRSGLQASMSGHPVTQVAARSVADHAQMPLDQILAISRRGSRLYDLQWRFAPVYAIGQFVAVVGAGAALIVAPAWAMRRRRNLRLALLLAMSLPLALLFLGMLDTGGTGRPYLILGGLAAAFTWLAWMSGPEVRALGALLSATTAIIAVDAVTGGHLLADSLVNFGAMSASRFYGIGNETMGFMIPCAGIGAAAIVQGRGASRWGMWGVGLWLAAVALVIGAPFWGANWGGGVTAAFAFTVAFLGMRAGRPRMRHWAAAAVIAAAMGALVVALDLLGNPQPISHIGDSARLVASGGVPAAVVTITRKVSGNLRIASVVPYTVLAPLLCLIFAWLVLRPAGRLRAALEANRMIWGGLAGGTLGGIVAVLVNDSGIVAAATAIGATACAMVYLALEQPEASQ